jgi:hypothetical protein
VCDRERERDISGDDTDIKLSFLILSSCNIGFPPTDSQEICNLSLSLNACQHVPSDVPPPRLAVFWESHVTRNLSPINPVLDHYCTLFTQNKCFNPFYSFLHSILNLKVHILYSRNQNQNQDLIIFHSKFKCDFLPSQVYVAFYEITRGLRFFRNLGQEFSYGTYMSK